MTTVDIPTSTDFVSAASSTVQGFNSDVPATAPGTPAPAAPAPVAATPAVPAAAAAPEAAKPADASATPPAIELKGDGMRADDLKAIATVLGEHKVDAKAGQAILDKTRETIKAGINAALLDGQAQWRAENAKDATAAPRIDAALSVVSSELREALRGEVYVDHPVLHRALAEIGAFVQKATKQDTAVTGASPAPAPKFDPANTSSAAFAGGVAGGF